MHSQQRSSGRNTIPSVHVRPKYERVHERSFAERVQAQHCSLQQEPQSPFKTNSQWMITTGVFTCCYFFYIILKHGSFRLIEKKSKIPPHCIRNWSLEFHHQTFKLQIEAWLASHLVGMSQIHACTCRRLILSIRRRAHSPSSRCVWKTVSNCTYITLHSEGQTSE